jgi:hypothetical protein
MSVYLMSLITVDCKYFQMEISVSLILFFCSHFYSVSSAELSCLCLIHYACPRINVFDIPDQKPILSS